MWEDFSEMVAYSDVWSKYNGGGSASTTGDADLRYRKDLTSAASQFRPPGKSCRDGRGLHRRGKRWLGDRRRLIKGAFLNVPGVITLQAGGNPFEVGDEYRTALQ